MHFMQHMIHCWKSLTWTNTFKEQGRPLAMDTGNKFYVERMKEMIPGISYHIIRKEFFFLKKEFFFNSELAQLKGVWVGGWLNKSKVFVNFFRRK